MKAVFSVLGLLVCIFSLLQWSDLNPMLLNETYRTFYNAHLGIILIVSALFMLLSGLLVFKLAKE